MDDLFDNMFNDVMPLDSLIEEDRPSLLPVFNALPDDPPFLLDDGIIPDSDEAFFAPPPPRKRRFMDHKTSIFTIIRETPVKEPNPNHTKFLEKRRRAVALRLNAQGPNESTKPVEQQTQAPRVIKKIEQKMRNRISAQLSRDRKRSYVNILERQNADLRKENKMLKDELEALQDEISKMREKCAMSTVETGPKANNGRTQTQSNGNSGPSSNNGSQNQSPTMTEDGNQSEQNSEAIFREQDEGLQRHVVSGNSLFLSLFSVLSVCAMIAISQGPMGMHGDHAQTERLRILAAMQPRCAGYGTNNPEVQKLYDKIHKLKHDLNASKIEKSKMCVEPPAEKQCSSLMNNTTASMNSGKMPTKSHSKMSKKKNLRSTAVMEYNHSGNMTLTNSTNSTKQAGTLFCPSAVLVANMSANSTNSTNPYTKKESPSAVAPMSAFEILKSWFGQESVLQMIVPTTNMTILGQIGNGKSEITQFPNREDKLIELICVVKSLNEVS